MGKPSIKKIIVRRVQALYLLFFALALVVLGKILYLQLLKGEELRQKAEDLMLKYVTIEPNRGDIYARGGKRLLATSVPYYEIRLDLNSSAMKDAVFTQGIDSLSYRLSRMFPDKSKATWKRELIRARKEGKRYHLLRRQVSYRQLQEMKTFPIFRLGKYKGGFITVQSNRRVLPHQQLAARTIGYLSKSERGNVVGLEGAYDHFLAGVKGIRLMQKTAGNTWIPVNDANEVEPQNGYDVVTTIDVDIQDVAENALLKQLSMHQAHHGCAILMEVETGDIRAIANLARNSNGKYAESYNYAIAESTEPGSTFKLASMIVALEDGYIDLDDTIDTGKGAVRYYDKVIRDTRWGGYGVITVKEAFEVSSNVALSRIIHDHYRKRPEAFVERLYRMHLNEPVGIEIRGEGEPLIRYPGDDYWSGISLPMMSHGYEVRMTPLQVLTFYNAVANDGKMVKPRIVESIRYYGNTVKRFSPRVIDQSICSDETLRKVKVMLEGVVENGTARNLSNENFKIAGKTGTAQIANAKYGYKVDSRISYQASFVGYFPAEKPKYSCIVVVNSPTSDVYYGNLVAGPVFREISRKVYATSLDLQQGMVPADGYRADIPYSKNGYRESLESVLKELDIPLSGQTGSDWVKTTMKEESVLVDPLTISGTGVPNVKEMGARDAVYLLENAGLKVMVNGRGKVVEQSLPPGSPIIKGQKIVLTMSFT
jgi:cell division protein FtsI (penicillin-binding protein 3)